MDGVWYYNLLGPERIVTQVSLILKSVAATQHIGNGCIFTHIIGGLSRWRKAMVCVSPKWVTLVIWYRTIIQVVFISIELGAECFDHGSADEGIKDDGGGDESENIVNNDKVVSSYVPSQGSGTGHLIYGPLASKLCDLKVIRTFLGEVVFLKTSFEAISLKYAGMRGLFLTLEVVRFE